MPVPNTQQGYSWKNVLASFVHLHFGSRPGLAAELVERCAVVDLFAVRAAAAAAAEAAGPRSFPADANRGGRGYSSAHVSPESTTNFPSGARPIFPVRLPARLPYALQIVCRKTVLGLPNDLNPLDPQASDEDEVEHPVAWHAEQNFS